MATKPHPDQVEEQLALLQIGSVIRDITPRDSVPIDYIPSSLEEAADVLDAYLNIKLYNSDKITDLRDRVIKAYTEYVCNGIPKRIISPDKAFDYAMKGV